MPISPSTRLTSDFALFDQYPTTAILEQPVNTLDAGGSPVQTFVEWGEFQCRIQGPPSQNEVDDHALGQISFYDAMLFCDVNVPITESDRIIITEASGTITTWDVVGTDNVNLEDVFLQVTLKRHK